MAGSTAGRKSRSMDNIETKWGEAWETELEEHVALPPKPFSKNFLDMLVKISTSWSIADLAAQLTNVLALPRGTGNFRTEGHVARRVQVQDLKMAEKNLRMTESALRNRGHRGTSHHSTCPSSARASPSPMISGTTLDPGESPSRSQSRPQGSPSAVVPQKRTRSVVDQPPIQGSPPAMATRKRLRSSTSRNPPQDSPLAMTPPKRMRYLTDRPPPREAPSPVVLGPGPGLNVDQSPPRHSPSLGVLEIRPSYDEDQLLRQDSPALIETETTPNPDQGQTSVRGSPSPSVPATSTGLDDDPAVLYHDLINQIENARELKGTAKAEANQARRNWQAARQSYKDLSNEIQKELGLNGYPTDDILDSLYQEQQKDLDEAHDEKKRYDELVAKQNQDSGTRLRLTTATFDEITYEKIMREAPAMQQKLEDYGKRFHQMSKERENAQNAMKVAQSHEDAHKRGWNHFLNSLGLCETEFQPVIKMEEEIKTEDSD